MESDRNRTRGSYVRNTDEDERGRGTGNCPRSVKTTVPRRRFIKMDGPCSPANRDVSARRRARQDRLHASPSGTSANVVVESHRKTTRGEQRKRNAMAAAAAAATATALSSLFRLASLQKRRAAPRHL